MPAAIVTQAATNRTNACVRVNVLVRAQSMTVAAATIRNINEQADMIDEPTAGIRSYSFAFVLGSTNDEAKNRINHPATPVAADTSASRM
ncbi:hypothetical protein [Stieleria maiorica]|uniref:hypothetical protein n=1 Tax=Stieleria maiorica TaxID=2795974 RepID=UPI0011C876EE|nr:hypothetical protein [Stieleria maiorica]